MKYPVIRFNASWFHKYVPQGTGILVTVWKWFTTSSFRFLFFFSILLLHLAYWPDLFIYFTYGIQCQGNVQMLDIMHCPKLLVHVVQHLCASPWCKLAYTSWLAALRLLAVPVSATSLTLPHLTLCCVASVQPDPAPTSTLCTHKYS